MAKQQADEMRYTECFVAFIDILGFADAVRKSVSEPHLLKNLARATNFMADMPSGTKTSRRQNGDGTWTEKEWRIQARSFSDTVVIFMPCEMGSISQMLFMIRYLHDRMLELKLCMRGAVTIGNMYWNDAWSNNSTARNSRKGDVLYQRGRNQDAPVTIGPGLIEAYELESECAVYPRILVSPKLVDHVNTNPSTCTPFGPYQPPDRPLTDFFRVDADGLRFLDLLHPEITRNDTERIIRQAADNGQFTIHWERDSNNHYKVITATHSLIDDWLSQKECTEKIRAKYEWLKSYAANFTSSQPEAGGQ